MKPIRGIIPAIVTPMIDQERIDYAGLETLVDLLIQKGVRGIFVLGTTGEFYALSESEKGDVVTAAVNAAAGRVPVIAGAGDPSTLGVIRLCYAYQEIGADAVSILSPYFIAPDQEHLYLHYETIARQTEIPAILYNIPSRTGVNLAPETVARIAKISSYIGIKDTSGDMNQIKALIAKAKSETFGVLVGSDELILEALQAGADGAVAATTNIAPELLVSIYERFEAGDMEGARAAQEKLMPLCAFLQKGMVPGLMKQFVALSGKPAGPARLPVTGLPERFEAQMREILAGLN